MDDRTGEVRAENLSALPEVLENPCVGGGAIPCAPTAAPFVGLFAGWRAVANSASEPHAGAATLGIGFSWGGWMLGSTAKTLADSTASSAAIAPICADQFQRSADAAVFLTALKAAGR